MKKNTVYTIGSLLVLLICAFCFVILPAFTGSEKGRNIPPFGKYGKKEIVYEQDSDFYDYVSQYGQIFQSYGQQLNEQTYYTIFRYAFDATVRKYAYEDAVNRSGYVVPESAIDRNMIPLFYDENGKYSSKLYRQTDPAVIEKMRKSIREGLIASRYSDDLFGSEDEIAGTQALYGLKESDSELNFLLDFNSNKRGFKMALFNISDYPEDEKLKFANENKIKFDKFDLSLITVEDKAQAEKVLKRINNNEITFEDAVSEYSLKYFSNTEGKITSAYQYQIENLLINKNDISVLSDLATDSVSSVIETSNSYSIFKKDGETTPADFATSEYQDLVSNYLRNYEKTRIEDYFISKAKNLIAESEKSDFDAACAALNAEKVDVAPFPLNYGSVSVANSLDKSIAALSSADTNEKFLETAFSLELNQTSEPLVLGNYIAVLKFTEEEKKSDEESTATFSGIANLDEESANDYVFSNKKLKNNFASVFFNNIMSY